MRNLTPSRATYWYAYKDGVLHHGCTDPGLTTSVHDDCDFQHGDDILERIQTHRRLLRAATADETAERGFYLHEDKAVQLLDEDCVDARSVLDAVATRVIR